MHQIASRCKKFQVARQSCRPPSCFVRSTGSINRAVLACAASQQAGSVGMPSNNWDASTYVKNAAFVSELGNTVFSLLNPQKGQRILDLGCGDGRLTKNLVDAGCSVTGVDFSSSMVEAAVASGLQAQVMDGENLTFRGEFDAVFSNAALHWMSSNPDAVVQGVAAALRPGGVFVAEFGGHNNVASVCIGCRAVFQQYGVKLQLPWYYPSAEEYKEKLEKHGFIVDKIELVPRPTPLPTGLDGWLQTFAGPIFSQLPAEARDEAYRKVIEAVQPTLQRSDGVAVLDYVRLRFRAHLRT